MTLLLVPKLQLGNPIASKLCFEAHVGWAPPTVKEINLRKVGSAHPTCLMPKLNTKLESEAAEFLVLGHLLLEGISAFKTYTNFPGYDLIATDAAYNTSARLQVKSRYKTDHNGFIINNFSCDFVVFVTLNRGFGNGINKMEILG